MASLVESGTCGAIKTTDTTTNVFCVIMFTSEAYTLQENTTIDGKIITDSELVVKAQYICYFNNWNIIQLSSKSTTSDTITKYTSLFLTE